MVIVKDIDFLFYSLVRAPSAAVLSGQCTSPYIPTTKVNRPHKNPAPPGRRVSRRCCSPGSALTKHESPTTYPGRRIAPLRGVAGWLMRATHTLCHVECAASKSRIRSRCPRECRGVPQQCAPRGWSFSSSLIKSSLAQAGPFPHLGREAGYSLPRRRRIKICA